MSPKLPAIPLSFKVAYTLWTVFWLAIYWAHYGIANQIWLCDFANLVTLAAIWLESPLVLSSQLVAVAIPQIGWTLDYAGKLLLGFHPIGGTEYMFDPAKPWGLRALSLFHLWMLPLLFWLVRRVGYDRRGVLLQTALMTVLLLPLSWLVGTREENLNWVWGPFGQEQTWMAPGAWFACLFVLYPLVLFLPPHWALRGMVARGWMPAARSAQEPDSAPVLTRSTARS